MLQSVVDLDYDGASTSTDDRYLHGVVRQIPDTNRGEDQSIERVTLSRNVQRQAHAMTACLDPKRRVGPRVGGRW
jgi:hypothetical protein